MRFHLNVAFSCPVHTKTMKMQTFENAFQIGKIWKRNSIGVVWTGRIHWKRKLLKTIGHVISVPVHFHLKNLRWPTLKTRKLSRHAQRKVDGISVTCIVLFRRRVKRFGNDRVDTIPSFRFQWNENANFWKRIRTPTLVLNTCTAHFPYTLVLNTYTNHLPYTLALHTCPTHLY